MQACGRPQRTWTHRSAPLLPWRRLALRSRGSARASACQRYLRGKLQVTVKRQQNSKTWRVLTGTNALPHELATMSLPEMTPSRQ